MITFYATTPHRYTFRRFRNSFPPDQIDDVRVVGYSALDLSEPPAAGLHVLTDFERLMPPERAFVKRLHSALARRQDTRVIGDPRTWLNRHQLLTRLADEGINDFRSYTLDQLGPHVRFPVFLRWANDHGGSLGGPIEDQASLDRRLARIKRDHHRRMRWIGDQLLVIEKIDAISPDGLFRKYSVFRVGDEFVPRHMIVAPGWVTKYAKVATPELAQEEQDFLDAPRDIELIKRVFDMAGIQFGRIDWGYVGDRPQIWEINTNPTMVAARTPHELREPGQRQYVDLARAAVLREVPESAGLPSRRPLIPAPERWAWAGINRGSRALDAKRA